MNNLLDTRKCKDCDKEKIIILHFTYSKNPKECKECINRKKRAYKHKNYAVESHCHWRKRRFIL